MSKPALFMPIGNQDASEGTVLKKVEFMEVILPKLDSLGWTIGIDFKSYHLFPMSWQLFFADRVIYRGGRISWHPADFLICEGIGKTGKITEKLETLGKEAAAFKGLEALVVHSDMLQLGLKEDLKGSLGRYNARVTANQMVDFIHNHVEPLKKLNEICGGILCLENVHNCLFNHEDPSSLPTYEALQLGYLEVPWIAREAGIGTVFDSEHFFAARNFYFREKEFAHLEKYFPRTLTKGREALVELAGYIIDKGRPAVGAKLVNFADYIDIMKPRLFHIGGARRLVGELGRIATHVETDINSLSAINVLLTELGYIMKNNCLGAVVEVEGINNRPNYSPRSADDFVAKMRECLTVVDAIEKLQKGIWKVNPKS